MVGGNGGQWRQAVAPARRCMLEGWAAGEIHLSRFSTVGNFSSGHFIGGAAVFPGHPPTTQSIRQRIMIQGRALHPLVLNKPRHTYTVHCTHAAHALRSVDRL